MKTDTTQKVIIIFPIWSVELNDYLRFLKNTHVDLNAHMELTDLNSALSQFYMSTKTAPVSSVTDKLNKLAQVQVDTLISTVQSIQECLKTTVMTPFPGSEVKDQVRFLTIVQDIEDTVNELEDLLDTWKDSLV